MVPVFTVIIKSASIPGKPLLCAESRREFWSELRTTKGCCGGPGKGCGKMTHDEKLLIRGCYCLFARGLVIKQGINPLHKALQNAKQECSIKDIVQWKQKVASCWFLLVTDIVSSL